MDTLAGRMARARRPCDVEATRILRILWRSRRGGTADFGPLHGKGEGRRRGHGDLVDTMAEAALVKIDEGEVHWAFLGRGTYSYSYMESWYRTPKLRGTYSY